MVYNNMRTQQVGSHKTVVYNDNGDVVVRYHQTEVVRFDERRIILNSNGYQTHTTKQRMNQASNEYNLGFEVYQRDYTWFVDYKGQTLEFHDCMVLVR